MKKKYFLLLLIFPFFTFSQGSGSCLSLNGSNQLISVPALTPIIGNSDFTVECFVNFNSFTDYGGLITTFISSNGGWALMQGIDGSITFIIGNDSSGAGSDSVSSSVLITNKWYHIVGVKRGGVLELYVNGELQGTIASSRTISNNTVNIGARYLDYSIWRHNGLLDEIKIWNKALTQNEIRSYITKKITISHPNYSNLVAYYNADSGFGSTLVDQTSNGNNGTLINNPIWQISGAPIGDDSTYLTSVSNGSSINLAHTDGSNLTVNVSSGTAESLYIYNVKEEPNITTPPIGLNQLSQGNYFGVKAFGGSSLMYDVVYDYTGHSGISNENNLRLSSRTNNAISSWVEQAAILNISTNTLALGGQSGTEFILGSVSGNTLPVDALSLNKMVIYPNPTNNVLQIQEGKFVDKEYQIYDIKGRKLIKGVIQADNLIDVKSLKKGVYFLKIEKFIPFKFVKS